MGNYLFAQIIATGHETWRDSLAGLSGRHRVLRLGAH